MSSVLTALRSSSRKSASSRREKTSSDHRLKKAAFCCDGLCERLPKCGVTGQFSQHPRQTHFCLSSLESAIDRGLDPTLSFGGTNAVAEEVGIAAEVLNWRQRDRIDPVLN